MALQAVGAGPMIEWYAWAVGQAHLERPGKCQAERGGADGRAAVRARMKGRACQGLGRRGYAHRSSTTDLERESKSAFLPKENCNRQQTTTRTPAPPLIRNASAKRSRPGRGRPGVAPAGSIYGAVISGRFCVDQDLNIDLGPKSESGPGFDMDHTLLPSGA